MAALPDFVKFGKKIAGAGLNYRGLLKLRGLSDPEKPSIFLKATSSYLLEGGCIEILPGGNLQQEVELGIVIGKKCRNVREEDVFSMVGGYCLALDMTDTTAIQESREKGLPWSLAKSFDTACPVSRFISCDEIPNPNDIRLWCKINGVMKQDSTTADLFFSIPQLVSFVSQFMTLEPCDVILTGSPPGIEPVRPGDVIECGLADILTMKFPVIASKIN